MAPWSRSRLEKKSGAGAGARAVKKIFFLWPLGAEAARKKVPGAGAVWEQKSGAGAA